MVDDPDVARGLVRVVSLGGGRWRTRAAHPGNGVAGQLPSGQLSSGSAADGSGVPRSFAAGRDGRHTEMTVSKPADMGQADMDAAFRALAEAIPGLALITDAGGLCRFANGCLQALVGNAPLAGAQWRRFLHPADEPAVRAAMEQAVAGRDCYQVEARLRRADGAWRWFQLRGQACGDPADGPSRWLNIGTDITELVVARERLLRRGEDLLHQAAVNEARFQAIFDSQYQFIGLLSLDGILLEANSSVLVAAGMSREEAIGRPIWDALRWPPAERAWLHDAVASAARGELVRRELVLRRSAGTTLWIDFSLKPVHDPRTGEVVLLIPEGRDITERRLLEARLAQAEKLSALGGLASGIAHDFNNVLQGINGAAALIERRPDDIEEVRRLARMVLAATERAASVTGRLLAFSRQVELRAGPIEVASLLHELVALLGPPLGAGVCIKVELPDGLPALLADRPQLETAIINLATNARDAMQGGGHLTLSAHAEQVPPGVSHAAGLLPGRYVAICLADDGAGMEPEVLARAFEPFFTTKAPGSGTGLGLPMVRGFAEQSGGGLTVESHPGAGTRVTLWLPEAPPARQTALTAPEPPQAADAQPRPHVLLVDDETLVRELLCANLEELGCKVCAVCDGVQALAVLQDGQKIDILVTDLSMPGIDGLALIRQAQALRTGLPAVLLTGYAGEGTGLEVGDLWRGPFAMLRKPVHASELAGRITALLAPVPRRDLD
jgi:PAS domain S-box-containing protein